MKTMKFKRAMLVLTLLVMTLSAVTSGTIAWFTDSVTSENNVITSGNLDIEMSYLDGNTWKDASKGAIFNYSLWEPGYTQVREVKIENKGNLALKFQLNIQPTVQAEEGKANLADVIEVYVGTDMNAKPASSADLHNLTAAGTIAELMVDEDGAAYGVLLPKGEESQTLPVGEISMWIALHMKEEAGNEYQNLSIGDGFALKLEATQFTYEEDSFDETYDEGAQLYVLVDTVDELQDAINNGGNVRLLKSLSLTDATMLTVPAGVSAAIDLNGQSITGKGTEAKATYLINNKGSLIINDTVGGGKIELLDAVKDPSFGYATDTILNGGNLVINGGTIQNNLSGASYAIDNNVGGTTTINGGNIINPVGSAIRVYSWSADTASTLVMNGGNVKGAYGIRTHILGNVAGKIDVTINGGIIIGTDDVYKMAFYSYSMGSNENHIITLNGGTYYGHVAFGGGKKISPETVTIKQKNCKFYGEVFSYDSNVVLPNIEAEGTYAVSNDDLNAALDDGETNIVVSEGTYTFPASKLNADTTITCEEGTVFEGTSSLNVKGATVEGATFSNKGNTAVSGSINGTFKDCTFTGSNGLRWCYAGEKVVFENCVFSGSVYGVHFDGGANEAIFRNCTFSGFNAMGGAITKLTMEGCTFKPNGVSGYNGINLWGSTDMKDCTFVFDGTTTEWVDACGDNKTLTFTNCVVSDGTTERALTTADVGDYGTGNTITVQ